MKILIKLLTVVFLFFSLTVAAKNPRPVDLHGQLRVEGNQLVNKSGIPPQLRGVSMSWSIWEGKKYYNPEVIEWLSKDFKINLLRAALGVQPNGGYLQNREEHMKLMMKVIDEAIKNGIYVLIDWHDHNAEQHLEESKEFFKVMAQKYAGNPNIIYEIYNEPVHQRWAVVKSYAVELIKTIREFDSSNVIVIGSPSWDQDVDIAALDPITGFENLAYSFHFYASDPYHQETLRAKGDLAIKRGIALFVTEWGVAESTGNGEFNREKTAVWLNWLEKNRLSWSVWHVTDKNETTAFLKPGTSAGGHWKKENLTECGNYTRELIQRLNK